MISFLYSIKFFGEFFRAHKNDMERYNMDTMDKGGRWIRKLALEWAT